MKGFDGSRVRSFGALACLLVAHAACVRSINPIGRESDSVFDAALVGAWADEDSNLYDVTAGDGGGYLLVLTDEDCEPATFGMFLSEFEDGRFLNVYSIEREDNDGSLDSVLRVPAFMIAHVDMGDRAAKVRLMAGDWLEDFLEENPGAARHAERDPTVLTGSVNEVRAFYLKHLSTPDAFDDLAELRKLGPEEAGVERARCGAASENEAEKAGPISDGQLSGRWSSQ